MQGYIFILACIIYSNTIPNKWTVDDSIIIHQNSFVKQGIAGIDDIFSTDAFTGFYGKDINAVSGGRYRPLTPALFAVQAEIFAPTQKDINQNVVKDKDGHKTKNLSKNTWFPNILHFFNMVWYGLLCLIIYRTLLLAFQLKWSTDDKKPYVVACATTLLFTVHPLHTEVVANVKSLDELLSLLGAIASLFCILKLYSLSQKEASQQEKTKWLLGSMISYLLALFAKESAITFIAIIPLFLWVVTTSNYKEILKLSLQLVVPLIIFLGIRSAVLHQEVKSKIGKELMNDPFLVLDEKAVYQPIFPGTDIKKLVNPNENAFTQMPFQNKMATNLHTFGMYLKLLVAPYPLTIDYYPRHIEIKNFSDFSVILSLLVHLALLIYALLNIRKKNLVAFGILYYFITFSIFSNIFFPIGTNMAERFMFMPSLGFCLIVAYLLYQLSEKINYQLKIKIAFAAIILLFSGLTFARNLDWKNDFTLFSKDIAVSKNSGKINLALASELINKAVEIDENSLVELDKAELVKRQRTLKSLSQENLDNLTQSAGLLKKAIEINPLSGLAWLKLGNVYHFTALQDVLTPEAKLRDFQIAISAYEEASKFRSAGMDVILNDYKAACLMDIGKLYGQGFNDIPRAIANLESAKQLVPKEPEVYMLLGTAYSVINNYEKAIENTKISLSFRPDDLDTKQNLAVAYQIYAFNVPSQRYLLPIAEKLLLEVLTEKKKFPDSGLEKTNSLIITLDLLLKNASINNNQTKQIFYKTEILKLNPNAFNTSK